MHMHQIFTVGISADFNISSHDQFPENWMN